MDRKYSTHFSFLTAVDVVQSKKGRISRDCRYLYREELILSYLGAQGLCFDWHRYTPLLFRRATGSCTPNYTGSTQCPKIDWPHSKVRETKMLYLPLKKAEEVTR